MRVVVTGASGFIGSHLVDDLLSCNNNVIGVSRSYGYLSTKALNNPSFTFIGLDLLQNLEMLDFSDVDVVINLASQQPRNELKWADYYLSNTEMVGLLWQKSKDASVKQFITVSSTSLYDFSFAGVIKESSNVSPTNFYGLSKYTGEQLIQIYSKSDLSSPQTTVLRFPSVFGRNHFGGFLYTYLKEAVANKDIDVFNHGKSLRNVLHVSDAVKAIRRTIEFQSQLEKTLTLLVGSNDSMSTFDIANDVIKALQSTSQITRVSKALANDGDVLLDLTKMKSILSINTMSVSEGILRYVEEMKSEV
ncbi:hypothetical protein TW85_03530 [Marinomonas sp. S3726]|uniref:NAD-dependent epimerase/dehydratase family protein n=1 Tax=Marinomonas sp. S3726 TaxID=579484 RepID=UPI0005F9F32D|nr:NAD(P)-dependent oxidoreductase [Marinomonas sp. S3726]KJZ15964.1 hypothetical protein TW85_03530 [Marinomonas sp. S3726]